MADSENISTPGGQCQRERPYSCWVSTETAPSGLAPFPDDDLAVMTSLWGRCFLEFCWHDRALYTSGLKSLFFVPTITVQISHELRMLAGEGWFDFIVVG